MILLERWFNKRDNRNFHYEIYKTHCTKAREVAEYYLLKVDALYRAMHNTKYSTDIIEYLTKVYNDVTPYHLQSIAYIYSEISGVSTLIGHDAYLELIGKVKLLSVAAGRASEAVDFANYLSEYEEESDETLD